VSDHALVGRSSQFDCDQADEDKVVTQVRAACWFVTQVRAACWFPA
jgi:hypothetical protein